MQNTIQQLIERIRVQTPPAGRTTEHNLSERRAADLGGIYPDDEFRLRAADLLLGMEADQFEDLLEGIADLSTDIYENSGDDAYRAVSELMSKARQALRTRMGN